MPSAAAAAPSPELLRQARRLELRARRLVTGLLAGSYASAFRGSGIEFEELRAYEPGDDPRAIDWKVTARRGTAFVRRYREERELTVWLVVDASSSGAFGSGGRLKQEAMAEVAAVLALAALRSHDRVGLLIHGERTESLLPPRRGRGHAWAVVREVLAPRPGRRGTDLAGALELLHRVARRRSVVFLLSDFLLPSAAAEAAFTERLRASAARHDLTAVVVTDPLEAALPAAGRVLLEDAETGETAEVDTGEPRFAAAFAAAAEERARRRGERLRQAGAGEIRLLAGEPWLAALRRYFDARERRRW